MSHRLAGNVRLARGRRNRYTGTMAQNLIDTEEELARIVREARTVAVIAMKDGSDEHVPAFAIPKALKARGLRVIPVNPLIQASLGMTAYPNLAAVPEPFDVVDVFRRSEKIPELAD
jgi:predicted CoA-binding protein